MKKSNLLLVFANLICSVSMALEIKPIEAVSGGRALTSVFCYSTANDQPINEGFYLDQNNRADQSVWISGSEVKMQVIFRGQTLVLATMVGTDRARSAYNLEGGPDYVNLSYVRNVKSSPSDAIIRMACRTQDHRGGL